MPQSTLMMETEQGMDTCTLVQTWCSWSPKKI